MLFSKKHDINLWLMIKADEENNKKILEVLKYLPDYFFATKQKEIKDRESWLNGEISDYSCDREKELYKLVSPPNSSYSSVDFSITLTGYDITLYVDTGDWYNFRWLFILNIDVDCYGKKDLKPLGEITINCGYFRDKIEEDCYHYYGDTISYYYKETSDGVCVISYIQKKRRIGFLGEQPKKEFRSKTFIEYKDIPFDKEITLETLQELCGSNKEKKSPTGRFVKKLKK